MQQPATGWRRRGSPPLECPGADDIEPPPFAGASPVGRVVRIADLELDPEGHSVSRQGQQVTLTRLQFRLLALLAEHVNDVVDYDQLIAEVWGHTGEESPSSLVKSHISRIRRKLGLGPPGPLAIKACPGRGYMLQCTRSGRLSPDTK